MNCARTHSPPDSVGLSHFLRILRLNIAPFQRSTLHWRLLDIVPWVLSHPACFASGPEMTFLRLLLLDVPMPGTCIAMPPILRVSGRPTDEHISLPLSPRTRAL